MDNLQERHIIVRISDEECKKLSHLAAEYDLDITTFLSKICRDIVRKDGEDSMPLRHLAKYLATRFFEGDDGFLTCLIYDDIFDAALDAMEQTECDDVQKSEQAKAWLDRVYTDYQDELQEYADPKEIAMEKLYAALKGVRSLKDNN